MKSVQIRSFYGPYFTVFSPNTGKYGPEKTPYLGTFYAVLFMLFKLDNKTNLAAELLEAKLAEFILRHVNHVNHMYSDYSCLEAATRGVL